MPQLRLKDTSPVIQKLLKSLKGGYTDEDVQLMKYVTVKDMAKVYEALEQNSEVVWQELKAVLIARQLPLKPTANIEMEEVKGSIDEAVGPAHLTDKLPLIECLEIHRSRRVDVEQIEDESTKKIEFHGEVNGPKQVPPISFADGLPRFETAPVRRTWAEIPSELVLVQESEMAVPPEKADEAVPLMDIPSAICHIEDQTPLSFHLIEDAQYHTFTEEFEHMLNVNPKFPGRIKIRERISHQSLTELVQLEQAHIHEAAPEAQRQAAFTVRVRVGEHGRPETLLESAKRLAAEEAARKETPTLASSLKRKVTFAETVQRKEEGAVGAQEEAANPAVGEATLAVAPTMDPVQTVGVRCETEEAAPCETFQQSALCVDVVPIEGEEDKENKDELLLLRQATEKAVVLQTYLTKPHEPEFQLPTFNIMRATISTLTLDTASSVMSQRSSYP